MFSNFPNKIKTNRFYCQLINILLNKRMKYIFGALVVLVIFTSAVYSQSNSNTSSVQLLVNYESLCPDSINFFNNHLNQAVKQFGSELEVKLIPWGIANVINISKLVSFIF